MSLIYKVTGANKSPAGKPARVYDVRYRNKVYEVGLSDFSNFWCTHNRWDAASVVLADDVTLYSVNREFAYFVRTPAKVNLAEAHAFYYAAQYYRATQVIVLPIADFHRLAAELGDPKGEVVFLYSTGRCGSTLLQQMMSAFPNTLSLSEPDSFTMLHALKTQDVPEAELKSIFQSVLRVECKGLRVGHTLVFKTRSQCTWQGAMAQELFPKVRYLFMYRNAVDVTFSMVRAFMHLPGIGLAFKESIPAVIRNTVLAAPLKTFLTKSAAHLFPKEFLSVLGPLALIGTGWVVESSMYLRLHEQGLPIRAVRYENLLEKSEGCVRALAKHLGVDLTPAILQQSLDAMKKDSQENSAVGMVSQTKKVFTDKDRQALLDMLAYKNFKPDAVLEGTLTGDE